MANFLLSSSIGSQLDALFASFDYMFFQFFGNMQCDILTFIAKCLTSFGAVIFIVLFAVMGAVMIAFKRTRKLGLAIVIAVLIGTLVTNLIVKPLFLRIRPYNTLQSDPLFWSWYVGAGMQSEADYCFPSGHTTGITEIAVVLMLFHIRSKRKAARFFCWIFPVLALAVGASRVYLMVHYATDVFGGLLIGAAAGVGGYLLSGLICRKAHYDEKNEKLLQDNITPSGIIAIVLAVAVMFLFAAAYIRATGGSDAIRCAYNEEYNCQNEAKISDKYPPINGEYYCKIHWKQLNGQ